MSHPVDIHYGSVYRDLYSLPPCRTILKKNAYTITLFCKVLIFYEKLVINFHP